MKSAFIDLKRSDENHLKAFAGRSRESEGQDFSKMLDEEMKPNDKNTAAKEKNNVDAGDTKKQETAGKPTVPTNLEAREFEFSPLRRLLYDLVYRNPGTWSIADRQFFHVDKNQDPLLLIRKALADRRISLSDVSTENPQSNHDNPHHEETSAPISRQSAVAVSPGQFIHTRMSTREIETREGITENRILEQLVDQLWFQKIGNGTEVRLVLKPEALGEVRLQLFVEGNAVTAKFETPNRRVSQILKDHLHELNQALTQQGLDVKSLEVEKIS